MRFETDERGFLRVQEGGAGGGSFGPLVMVVLLVGLWLVISGQDGGALGARARESVLIGRYEAVLAGRGLRPTAHAVHTDTTCYRFFTGELATLVANTPCRSIRRAVFAAVDPHGNPVVLAIAWVGMPDSASATAMTSVFRTGAGGVAVLPAPHVPRVSAPTATRDGTVTSTTAVLVAANTTTHTSSRPLTPTTNAFTHLPPL